MYQLVKLHCIGALLANFIAPVSAWEDAMNGLTVMVAGRALHVSSYYSAASSQTTSYSRTLTLK